MNRTLRSLLHLCLAVAAFAVLSALPAVLHGQTADKPLAGVPEDWSHHHLVFSNPGTKEDAARKGRLAEWNRTTNDLRYRFQQRRQTPKPTNARGALEKDWSMNIGTTTALQANQYPAKFTFVTNTTGSCSDYVVFPTGVGGTAATVIAFDNTYGHTTCPSAATNGAPTVYWAYNTGGTAVLSPVLSWDATGSQVVYIQSVAGVANLVVLRWANSGGTAASPASITSKTPSTYNGCTAPCYTALPLHGNPADTNSAPFYVYDGSDTLYVGDDAGKLHKFTGVFNGTPTEVVSVTAPVWPIAVSANKLTSPVYDSGTSGNIFVADSGGFLYSYKASTAVHGMTSSKLTYASGTVGITDSPIVDSSAQEVYVFVGDDANTSSSVGCDGTAGCTGVFQFPAGNTTQDPTTACAATTASAWPSGTNCGVESVFGVAIATEPTIYDGAFDHIYEVGTGKSGNLWVCAEHKPASGSSGPRLSYVPLQSSGSIVSSGVIGLAATAITAMTTNSSTTGCSAVTEIWGSGGGTSDYIFLSMTSSGNLTTTDSSARCTGACLYNFVVATGGTATTAGSLTVPTTAYAGIAATGGTTGIIIDNTSSTTGESQIYYTTLSTQSCANSGTPTTGNCAVQTLQTAP